MLLKVTYKLHVIGQSVIQAFSTAKVAMATLVYFTTAITYWLYVCSNPQILWTHSYS